jgi:hypothetical protein
MKQYEYKLVRFPAMTDQDDPVVEAELNEIGLAGWELCGPVIGRLGIPCFWFKRELSA